MAFLNHDDIWLPDHLALCRETLLGQGADLVFGASAHLVAESPAQGRFDGLGVAIAGTGSGYGWSPAGVEDSVAPASTWLMRREVPERLKGWRLGRECYTDPSQDFLFRVWRAGFRIRSVRDVTVVMFTSGRRPVATWRRELGAGMGPTAHRRPGFLLRACRPGLRMHEWFNVRTRSRGAGARRLGGHAVAAVGLSPRSLYFRLKKGLRRGLHTEPAERPGPALVRPTGGRGPVHAVRHGPPGLLGPPAGSTELHCRRRGARFLASGWSRPESSGVWTTARRPACCSTSGANRLRALS